MQAARDTLKRMCETLPTEVVEELIEVGLTLQHQAAASAVEDALDDEERGIVAEAMRDPSPETYSPEESKAYLARRRATGP